MALSQSQWKKAIRERAGERCERCGRPEDPRPKGGTWKHECHHKDRDRTNNVLSNGEYLCASCHADEHDDPALKTLVEAVRRNSEDPEWRKRRSGQATQRYEDPVERRKTGEATSRRYEDPAERMKTGSKCSPDCTCGRHGSPHASSRPEHSKVMKAAWEPGGKLRVAYEQRKAARMAAKNPA